MVLVVKQSEFRKCAEAEERNAADLSVFCFISVKS